MSTMTLATDPGSLIAERYRIEREIARGGIAIVHEAVDVLEGRRVAVKVLREGANATAAERLVAEAIAVSRIDSPHVVRVLDVLKRDGFPVIVMELLNGEDLSSYLARTGPLPLAEAASYVIDACHALADAHATGIVHRDIKPANLFRHVEDDGRVVIKVIDFGIAKTSLTERTLTGEGQLLGSPPYMSPEQIQDARAVDPRADLWSLGIVLYRLLTGELPFEASSVPEVVARILFAPQMPSLAARGFPRALDDVLARCVAVDPSDRFEDVMTLARALTVFTQTPRKERFGWLITVAVAALIVAVANASSSRTPRVEAAPAAESPIVVQEMPLPEVAPPPPAPVTYEIPAASASASASAHRGPRSRPGVRRSNTVRSELQRNPYTESAP